LQGDPKKREAIEKTESSHFQPKKTPFMLLSLILVVLAALIRGNKRADSLFGIKTCSAGDWTTFAVFIVICLVITYFVVRILRQERDYKVKVGYNFHHSDIIFDSKTSVKMCVISVLVGIAGASLGIGGGMIINPLLLSLGQLPQVASATGMYIVIYSAGAISIQFMLSDALLWDYAIICGISTLIGTYLGISIVNKLVKRTGRQSLLVLILAVLITMSLIIIPINSGLKLKEKHDDGIDILAFGNICK
jgi:uncharacterized membrane protein YfcA